MHRDESHSVVVDAVADLCDQFVVDFAVRHVAPPHEYVGIVKNLIRKALIRVIQSGQRDFDFVVIFAEEFFNGPVNPERIKRLCVCVGLLMTELVPDRYADFYSHGQISFFFLKKTWFG